MASNATRTRPETSSDSLAADAPQGEALSMVRAVPGMARLAVLAWMRTTEWGIETSLRAGSRVMRAAVAGESPADLVQDASAELREYLRRLLELSGAADGPAPTVGDEPAEEPETPEDAETERVEEQAGRAAPRQPDDTPARLRERGAELLRRSAEVGLEEEAHPAFARILDQLTPDEGRILRLLALEGPQASIDVRTSRLTGSSDLVAPGLNMIDSAAGCRSPDRVAVYLDNLHRLGLVWFSQEPLEDVNRYLLLEAQPEVAEAIDQAGRARTVRRSIRLTPFGEEFCETCLPLHTAELEALGEPAAESVDGEKR